MVPEMIVTHLRKSYINKNLTNYGTFFLVPVLKYQEKCFCISDITVYFEVCYNLAKQLGCDSELGYSNTFVSTGHSPVFWLAPMFFLLTIHIIYIPLVISDEFIFFSVKFIIFFKFMKKVTARIVIVIELQVLCNNRNSSAKSKYRWA